MSTILITGRNGFIANALVETLKEDHKVISLVRSRKNYCNYNNEELLVADLLSLSLEQLRGYKIDLIIHAAALIQGHPNVVCQSNIQTSKNIFHVAERLNIPIIFFSSINALFSEKLGGYARSKKVAEEMLRASELRYLILRLPFVLGGNSTMVRTIKNFADKFSFFPLFGLERGKTHVITVDAVVEFLQERTVEGNFSSEIINLVSRRVYIYPEIIQKILGRKINFVTIPYGLSLTICRLLEVLKLGFPVTSEQIKSFNINKVIEGDRQDKTIFIDEDPKVLFC